MSELTMHQRLTEYLAQRDADGAEVCTLGTDELRDLLAAQARVRELEATLITERERNPVAMLKLDGDQAALVAAVATIARVERVVRVWEPRLFSYAAYEDKLKAECSFIRQVEAALAQPSYGATIVADESAPRGTMEIRDHATGQVLTRVVNIGDDAPTSNQGSPK